jgi:hypothetical protein
MRHPIHGGASFPARAGTLSVSWPVASLSTGVEGITVDVRSRVLKRILSRFVEREPSNHWWFAKWCDISSVEFGERSIVLRAVGTPGCRFVTLSRERMMPLIEEIRGEGIQINQVSSTLGWYIKQS